MFKLGPGQSCIATKLALLLTQEEGPINKLFSQRHAYLDAWDVLFSIFSFSAFVYACTVFGFHLTLVVVLRTNG